MMLKVSLVLLVGLIAYASAGSYIRHHRIVRHHRPHIFSHRQIGYLNRYRPVYPRYRNYHYAFHHFAKKQALRPTRDHPMKFEYDFCKNGVDGHGKLDGDHPHPKHCEKYITCKGFEDPHSNHYQPKVYVQECNGGFFFNSKTSSCDWPSNVDCFLYQGRTCFGTKNDRYGAVGATQTGYIKGMKVIHVDGYVTCKYYQPTYKSFWGCNTKEQKFKYLVNTWITTKKNAEGIIFPNYKTKFDPYGNYALDGYNQKSPYLMWKQGPHMPSKVHKGDELRVWYGEDLFNMHQHDNAGKHCVDVYALFSYYKPHYFFETHEHQ